MSAPAFARYVTQVALPLALERKAMLDQTMPHRCTDCGTHLARKAKFCGQCKVITRDCEWCDRPFNVDRSDARSAQRRFCNTECSQKWVKSQCTRTTRGLRL